VVQGKMPACSLGETPLKELLSLYLAVFYSVYSAAASEALVPGPKMLWQRLIDWSAIQLGNADGAT
jgi:hypothetical protein